MNPYDTYTVDQLLDLSTDTAPEVFTRLAAVTTTATSDGVTVHVNLEGRLVDLTLSPDALATGAEALAAAIFRLTQEAAAAALNRGIELLTPEVGEELAAELRTLVLPPAAEPPVPAAGTAKSTPDAHRLDSGVESPPPDAGPDHARPPHTGWSHQPGPALPPPHSGPSHVTQPDSTTSVQHSGWSHQPDPTFPAPHSGPSHVTQSDSDRPAPPHPGSHQPDPASARPASSHAEPVQPSHPRLGSGDPASPEAGHPTTPEPDPAPPGAGSPTGRGARRTGRPSTRDQSDEDFSTVETWALPH